MLAQTSSFIWIITWALSATLGLAAGAWVLGFQKAPGLRSLAFLSAPAGAISGFTIFATATLVTFGATLLNGRRSGYETDACVLLGIMGGILGGALRLRVREAPRSATDDRD